VFSADQPISRPQDDILSRADFSKSLATALRNWEEDSSLVTALYGAWGSGKSSVKNMVRHYLREEPATCPIIVEFNPWMYSTPELLAEPFLEK
jgi:predicted KAP-like P-loop ATPase